MSKKREINKNTKTYQNKIIKRLKNKLLQLWKDKSKERAGFKCEACGSAEMVQSHHLETYNKHKSLRYDLNNALVLCAKCHKFSPNSVHQSFIFGYKIMQEKHPEQIKYLLNYIDKKEELTIEILEQKIKEMEAIKFNNIDKEKQVISNPEENKPDNTI